MNNNNTHLNNTQPWMMPTDHGPEQYNYMISRPPGSVLPMPSRQREEELSISPPAQALNYESRNKLQKGGNRPVIPSKRAAQNRAAQKAFRQRREQYIKDLEIKAKEMEDWQNEMDNLRKENGKLRDKVNLLEKQVTILTGGDASKIPFIEQAVNIEEKERNVVNEDVISPTTRPIQPVSPLHADHSLEENTFATIPLRTPNQSNETIQVYDPNKKRKVDEQIIDQSQNIGQAPTILLPPPPPNPPPSAVTPTSNDNTMLQYGTNEYWNNNSNSNSNNMQVPEFDLDFDFDPFFEEEFSATVPNSNDFLPNANSGQVLDDLFAMLQTRQRPPIVPTDENLDSTKNVT